MYVSVFKIVMFFDPVFHSKKSILKTDIKVKLTDIRAQGCWFKYYFCNNSENGNNLNIQC